MLDYHQGRGFHLKKSKANETPPLPMDNPLGGAAPPLIIRKRIDQSDLINHERRIMLRSKLSKLQERNMSEFSHDLRTILKLMDAGDLEQANALMGQVEKAMRGKKVTNGNGTVADDWSEPADARQEFNNASDDCDYEDDGLDDDEEDDDIEKIWYPRDRQMPTDHDMQGPVTRHPTQNTYNLATYPTNATPLRHKFHSRTEFVQNRDQCSMAEAMSRARVEFPMEFADYQDTLARQNTSAQQMERSRNNIGKAAPETFESLVAAEMRKGCNAEIAAQRVVQLYGNAALRHRAISKSAADIAAIEERFVDRAEQIWLADEGISRTEALRKARLQNPRLAKALRSL